MEDQGLLFGVQRLPFDEGRRMLSPVAERIKVVRGMVAIVEAMAIALNSPTGSASEEEGRVWQVG
jgi:hypothetical protein